MIGLLRQCVGFVAIGALLGSTGSSASERANRVWAPEQAAIERLRSAAVSGDADAEYELAKALDIENQDAAIEWFRRAAEQGHLLAQHRLGLKELSRCDSAPNCPEAERWLREAAQHGEARSQFIFALLQQQGKGVAIDYVEAVKWLRLAAAQGYADAALNLANCYRDGKGTRTDAIESYKWFEIAAEPALRIRFGQTYFDAYYGQMRDEAAKVLTKEQLATAKAAALAWFDDFKRTCRSSRKDDIGPCPGSK